MPAACSSRTICLNCTDLAPRLGAFLVAAVRERRRPWGRSPSSWPACRLAAVRLLGRELVDRHQLDRGDAERLEVRDLLDHAEVGARRVGAGAGAVGEPADVHLVDDRLAQRRRRWRSPLPVEVVVDNDAFRRPDDAVVARQVTAGERLGERVDQPGVRVEPVPPLRFERPVGLEVVELPRLEVGDEDAPDVAPAVGVGVELDQPGRVAVGDLVVEQHPHSRRVLAEHDELHPVFPQYRPVGQRVAELHGGRDLCFLAITRPDWRAR